MEKTTTKRIGGKMKKYSSNEIHAIWIFTMFMFSLFFLGVACGRFFAYVIL